MKPKKLMYPEVKNFIGGQFVPVNKTIDVLSPLDGKVISTVTISTNKDLNSAVKAAKKAFQKWSKIPIVERVEYLLRYNELLKKNLIKLAEIIHNENGKTLDEAVHEIKKSIELTEYACSFPQFISDELCSISENVNCIIERRPLGVVASIVPFNFPIMIPSFTVPSAIILGNCMILKPSKQVPISSNKLAELLKQAGLPEGVFNIVNGDKEIVDAICDHPEIEAVSFLGSTRVAKKVYLRATSNLKSCLALGGAKNHVIILPDANIDIAVSSITASMSACSGQRCMSTSVLIAVGNVDPIIQEICDELKKMLPDKHFGPIISIESKKRIEYYITEAEKSGAKIIVDGRIGMNHLEGFYIGPTLIDYVSSDLSVVKEEVFGPVLTIVRVNNISEAIKVANSTTFGNAASIFTQNEVLANQFKEQVNAGMIGINVALPSAIPYSHGGWKESKYGTCDIVGKSSIEFWTKQQKISFFTTL